MSALREAIVLPLLFLTVTLIAAIRPGAAVEAPTPFSLVMGVLLLGSLVRSGALAPERLLSQERAMLANVNGAVVLFTLFAAAAELIALLTPASGVPRFFVSLFLFVLLLNTIVAMPDRVRVLRSLAVILLAAFVVKFVLLAGLSEAGGSRTARVFAALVDVVTLGSIAQPAQPASAPYLAFLAVALFLAGAAALPVSFRPRAGNALVPRGPADDGHDSVG